MNKAKFLAIILPLIGSIDATADEKSKQYNSIVEHVTTLASDKFAGRYPHSSGDSLATNYILDKLSSIPGVTLWGHDGQQRFSFALKDKHSAPDRSILISGNTTLTWGKEYYPTVYSASGGASANVVFAGYGIDAFGEHNRNDFEGVDLNGKWAMILREVPSELTAYNDHCTDYAKVQEAIKRGAVGVILVHGERDRWQLLESTEMWQPQCDIPVICVTRPAANKILAGTSKSIEQLEKEWVNEPQKVMIESNAPLTTNLEIIRDIKSTNNIIGIIEGSDPKLKDEIIIVGAHYDHVKTGYYYGNVGTPSLKPQIFNGANDNASGCAALLAMAEHYSKVQNKMKRSIAFVFFGAEECGLVGAKYLAQNLDLFENYGKPVLAINIDMIGSLPRAKDNALLMFGLGTFKEGNKIADEIIKDSELKITKANGMGITSDHIPFSQHAALPIMGFHTGDKNVHTPQDKSEYIDFESMDKIVTIINQFVDNLTLKKSSITYDSSVTKW